MLKVEDAITRAMLWLPRFFCARSVAKHEASVGVAELKLFYEWVGSPGCRRLFVAAAVPKSAEGAVETVVVFNGFDFLLFVGRDQGCLQLVGVFWQAVVSVE